jgi:hypothetical protein
MSFDYDDDLNDLISDLDNPNYHHDDKYNDDDLESLMNDISKDSHSHKHKGKRNTVDEIDALLLDDDFINNTNPPKHAQPPTRHDTFDLDDLDLSDHHHKPNNQPPTHQPVKHHHQSYDVDLDVDVSPVHKAPATHQPVKHHQSYDVDLDVGVSPVHKAPATHQPVKHHQSYDVDLDVGVSPVHKAPVTHQPVKHHSDIDDISIVDHRKEAAIPAPKKIENTGSGSSYSVKLRGVPSGVDVIIRSDVYESAHYIILEGAAPLIQGVMNHLKSTGDWTPLGANAMVNQKQTPLQKLYQYLIRQLHRCKIGKLKWNQGVDSSHRQFEEIQLWS